ncbi:MAG TPA: tRNA (N6-threonylcarbamoyladenosine(37)-N6)-methyltransferase TrmO [Edaphobacter sp.]|nr:tRNA (N6-threonylcarbamoyladenosine(37)-N6)-methyltransferase TrmO [Edaphobacter sp.]
MLYSVTVKMLNLTLSPIGYVRSSLSSRASAPKQPHEGAPSAHLDILPAFAEAVEGIQPGNEIWILTWLHQANRSTLKVHPRSDPQNPLTGVFATRSPDRPNPIGLHRATVLAVAAGNLEVQNLEAIDGTPILDIKPVIDSVR